jgi:hypothetical protein
MAPEAHAAAAARQVDQERQADIEAEEIARRQAAYWRVESGRQPEVERSEPDAEAETDFEAGS